MVIVTPQVSGIVTAITAQNPDFVDKGRVLIELDKTDAKIALEEAISDLGKAVRTVMQLMEEAKYYEALLLGKKQNSSKQRKITNTAKRSLKREVYLSKISNMPQQLWKLVTLPSLLSNTNTSQRSLLSKYKHRNTSFRRTRKSSA